MIIGMVEIKVVRFKIYILKVEQPGFANGLDLRLLGQTNKEYTYSKSLYYKINQKESQKVSEMQQTSKPSQERQ